MQQKKRQGLYKKYLISYISVALIVGIFVGMVLLLSSTYRMEDLGRRETEQRLTIATDYLEGFMDSVTDIAARIRVNSIFDSTYFKASALRECALIEQLANFKDFSQLIQKYSIYYPSIDSVYTPTSKSDFDLYARYVLGVKSTEELRLELAEQSMNCWRRSACLPDNYVYVRPISWRNDLALLVFITSQEHFEKQLSNLIGVEKGQSLGICLAEETVEDVYLKKTEATGNFTVFINIRDGYFGIQNFIITSIIGMIAVIVLGIVLAFTAAKRSYRPIQRLIYGYIPQRSVENNSEIELIEETLTSVLQDKNRSHRQLQKISAQLQDQQVIIRQFIAEELINGQMNSLLQYGEQLAGIRFPHKLFLLAIVHGVMPELVDRTKATLDSANDEETCIFAVWREQSSSILVFVNMKDEDCLPYVMEQIDSLFGEYGSIQYSTIVSSVANVRDAWIELNNLTEKPAEAILDRVVLAIEEGDSTAALMHIRELVGYMQRQSDMKRRGVHLLLIRCIFEMANKYQIPLEAEFMRKMMLMEDESDIITSLAPIVYELTSVMGRGINEKEAQKLIECIDKNLGNYELSKEWLANECGMTENMVGRVFKNVMKRTYTDYVRVCRMKRAKDMLTTTELSVTEIGNALGYINISYFIRSFKEYVGTTPALYRSEHKYDHSKK